MLMDYGIYGTAWTGVRILPSKVEARSAPEGPGTDRGLGTLPGASLTVAVSSNSKLSALGA